MLGEGEREKESARPLLEGAYGYPKLPEMVKR